MWRRESLRDSSKFTTEKQRKRSFTENLQARFFFTQRRENLRGKAKIIISTQIKS